MIETEIALVVASLLAGSALIWPASRMTGMPFAVLASAFGFFLSLLSGWILPGLTGVDIENGRILAFGLSVSSGTLTSLLLPVLLFQGGFGLDIRHLARDGVAVFTLAVIAVLLVVLGSGYLLFLASGMPIEICLLLAALVGTTDPSAVITIFSNLGVPPRLVRLVEGESLFNDATAIAIFGTLMVAISYGQQPSISSYGIAISQALAGGLVFGIVIGFFASLAVGRLRGRVSGQLSIIMATPFLVLGFAEVTAGISGVVAVVAAGTVLGTLVRSRIPEVDFFYVRKFIDMIASWTTGLIILIVACLAPHILFHFNASDVLPLLAVITGAFLSRAFVLWVLMPVLSRLSLLKMVKQKQRIALLWGGLRGAMTLALVVAVLEVSFLDFEQKRFIAVVATAYAFFTIFIQGATLQLLVRKLGLDVAGAAESALRHRLVLDTAKRTRDQVAIFASRASIEGKISKTIIEKIEVRLETVAARVAGEDGIPEREKVNLGLAMLVNRERFMVSDRQWSSGLPPRVLDQYLFFLGGMRDAVSAEGRLGYLRSARSPYKTSFWTGFLAQINYRFSISRPISVALARRFHLVVLSRIFTAELIWFNKSHLVEILGARVGSILNDVLEKRLEEIESELKSLRLQFPDFYTGLLGEILSRVAVAEELTQIDSLRAMGALDDNTLLYLERDVGNMEDRSVTSSRVDIEKPRAELLSSFPLLKDLSTDVAKKLSKRMRSRIVPAGKVIYRPRDRKRNIYFIASGAIQVGSDEDGVKLLGKGDLFGPLRMLGEKSRVDEAKAVRHSHIFVMKVSDFRRALRGGDDHKLLRRMKEAIRISGDDGG
jgi:CPA1 family monovalent cation:H+ antiporter